ncbi:MAG TPA: head-tail adaptor protein [Advenella kashmirensis]|uniref:Head-tail adaptor protein n=1 Tax=Advenella kashmirensis TaxID=310575 RepID=A0A356LAT9_9BURK|nr:head-tail adaptor protein [Advenella kashmirensis]
MRAGTLRTPIVVQKKGVGTGPTGQPIDTWVDFLPTRADILQSSGSEAIKSGIEVSQASASVRIRYAEGVTAGMRVREVSTGIVYDIESVLRDAKRRQYMDLVCKTGANDG